MLLQQKPFDVTDCELMCRCQLREQLRSVWRELDALSGTAASRTIARRGENRPEASFRFFLCLTVP